jgi:hypothetical protein
MRLNLAVFRADGGTAWPMGVRDDQDGELSRGRSFGSERVGSERRGTRYKVQGTRNPTGGKFAKEYPRRNEVNTRVENQRERINQGLKSQGRKRSSFAPTIVPLSSRSMPTSKATADT